MERKYYPGFKVTLSRKRTSAAAELLFTFEVVHNASFTVDCYAGRRVFKFFLQICLISKAVLLYVVGCLGLLCYNCENEPNNFLCIGEYNLKTCESGFDTCQTTVSYSGKSTIVFYSGKSTNEYVVFFSGFLFT